MPSAPSSDQQNHSFKNRLNPKKSNVFFLFVIEMGKARCRNRTCHEQFLSKMPAFKWHCVCSELTINLPQRIRCSHSMHTYTHTHTSIPRLRLYFANVFFFFLGLCHGICFVSCIQCNIGRFKASRLVDFQRGGRIRLIVNRYSIAINSIEYKHLK